MDRKESWNEFLDEEKKNVLLVRLICSEDFKNLDEFAIVYCAIKDDASHEVMRYDCSKREAVNVHQFFRKPTVKRYLKKEKSWETLYEFITNIKKNWIIYRNEYFGNI